MVHKKAKTIDLAQGIPSDEIESWRKANVDLLDTYEKGDTKLRAVMFELFAFNYYRVSREWDRTIDFVHQQAKIMKTLQAAVPVAELSEIMKALLPAVQRSGEIKALLANHKAISAQNSRSIGGKKRVAQSQKDKQQKIDKILAAKAELTGKVTPRSLSKEIARKTDLETEYVRKTLNTLSKKK